MYTYKSNLESRSTESTQAHNRYHEKRDASWMSDVRGSKSFIKSSLSFIGHILCYLTFPLTVRNSHRNWNKASSNPKWTNPPPVRYTNFPWTLNFCQIKALPNVLMCKLYFFVDAKVGKVFQFSPHTNWAFITCPLGFSLCFFPTLSTFRNEKKKRINRIPLWSFFSSLSTF